MPAFTIGKYLVVGRFPRTGQAGVESPQEQEKVGPRSGVFALGAVLYYLLTARAPFAGNSWSESMDRARRCDFDRSALDNSKVPRDTASGSKGERGGDNLLTRCIPSKESRKSDDPVLAIRRPMQRKGSATGQLQPGGTVC
jgi:hypothetical protein